VYRRHRPPEEILERVAEHEARIAQLIAEMQALLDEQHRIVAHLDRLQVKVEAIRAAQRGAGLCEEL